MKGRADTKERQLTQLRSRLRVRERQVAIATHAFKAMLEFESAPLSVFASEVRSLQLDAFHALSKMEEAQSGKELKAHTLIDASTRRKMILLAKVRLNTLYGPIGQKAELDE